MTETLTRPNGKTYRPRKPGLRAHHWENDWDAADTQGVVILGALDAEETRAFAAEMCAYWYGLAEGVKMPRASWWRLAMRDGERQWVQDLERGAPGVSWTAVGS